MGKLVRSEQPCACEADWESRAGIAEGWGFVGETTMMECGHYQWEQRDDGPGLMTLRCLVCGHEQHLHSYRDEGEDKWRDDRESDDRYD